jgi:hypothetical protein
MRHAWFVRLAATGAFAVLILGPLVLPTRADGGTAPVDPTLHCQTERSLVNGQWIEMPVCRRLAAPTF